MSVKQARLITITMPSNDAEALSKFYGDLFGITFGRTIKSANSSYQAWASAGVKWNISNRYSPNETTMIHLAVPSLEEYADKVVESGGTVYTKNPVDLKYHKEFINHYKEKFEKFKFGSRDDVTESLGRFHICTDPDGNDFGIIELEQWAAKLFENGEVTKIEHAEQKASLEHAAEFKRRNLG